MIFAEYASPMPGRALSSETDAELISRSAPDFFADLPFCATAPITNSMQSVIEARNRRKVENIAPPSISILSNLNCPSPGAKTRDFFFKRLSVKRAQSGVTLKFGLRQMTATKSAC